MWGIGFPSNGLFRGYIGIMEKKMETTGIIGLQRWGETCFDVGACRHGVQGFRVGIRAVQVKLATRVRGMSRLV